MPSSPTRHEDVPGSVTSTSMATIERHRLLSYLGPNWFASVMGTGIVATAGTTLPVHVPGLRVFALVVWVGAAILLAALLLVVGLNWSRNPTVARDHAHNPQMAHFYG